MNCYILAAGYGSRLKPITNNIPKCLVPINGIPLLHHWLKILTHDDVFEKIYINTHYLSNKVEEFIKNYNWNSKVILRYEDKLLGTAGSIKRDIRELENDDALILHADNLTFFHLHDYLNFHKIRKSNIEITMMTFKTYDPESCGTVILSDSIVIKFMEKDKQSSSNIANGAVYILSRNALLEIKKLKEPVFDFSKDIIPNFLNRIQVYHNEIYFRDIGSIESYNAGIKEFKYIAKNYNLDYFDEINKN